MSRSGPSRSSESGIVWRQPAEPKEIALGAPQTQDAEGAVRYHASGNGHELELLVDAQTCRDAMSGELFAYSARADARRQGIQRLRARRKIVSRANARGRMR